MQREGGHQESSQTTGRRDYQTQGETPHTLGDDELDPRSFYSQIPPRNQRLYLLFLPADIGLRITSSMAPTKRNDWSIEAGRSMSEVAPARMGDAESLGNVIRSYRTGNNELSSHVIAWFN